MTLDGLREEARHSWKIGQHQRVKEAEKHLDRDVPQPSSQSAAAADGPVGDLVGAIAAARHKVEDALASVSIVPNGVGGDAALERRVEVLERDNKDLRTEFGDLKNLVKQLSQLLKTGGGAVQKEAPAPEPKQEEEKDEEDEDIDLFGSDDEEEDEEKERIKQERLKAYEAKKEKKPGPIAKSSVVLDVKPWDTDTDMNEVDKMVRGIEMEGLLWGASKLVPVAYGIQKLQIMCVVEDEKVSVDALTETIEEFEDHVQSVDIAAFSKI